MLKGTIYITYDVNLCLTNLSTCKTIVVADEPDVYNIPGKIGGSLLVPPYQALAAVIDGDEEKFRYEYINYLATDMVVSRFINIILQALIAGTNMIILLDKEGPKFDMLLKQYFAMFFGIILGDANTQFQFDPNYIPAILNKLYADDDINAGYFLSLYPLNLPFDEFILRKLAFDYQIPFVNDIETTKHFKKMCKIMQNGGIIRNVVKRIG